jgi:uncharacterized membrane protein
VGRPEIFLWCMVGTAAALVAVSELIYLRDAFDGGPDFRMNTVFKLYYQVWLLLGVAGGPALAALVTSWRASLAPIFPTRSAELAVRLRRPVAHSGTPSAPRPVLARLVTLAAGVASTRAAVASDRELGPLAHRALADEPGPGEAEAGASLAGGGLPAAGEAATSAPAAAPDLPASLPPGGRLTLGGIALRWAGAGGTLMWMAAVTSLVGAAAVYPLQAAAARTANYSLPRSLDGTAYMDSDPFNQGDAAAIAWLDAHVEGDPVVLEASGGEYSHYDRVSAFTGLPTVLGWAGHEWQWRPNWLQQPEHLGELQRRQGDINQIYTSKDAGLVQMLLARYHVRYVYVGLCERLQYPGVDLGHLGSFLRMVYRSADVTIYAVS